MIQITQEEKLSAKTRIKLARAQGLLSGAKQALEFIDTADIDKKQLIKLIDEVLELLQ